MRERESRSEDNGLVEMKRQREVEVKAPDGAGGCERGTREEGLGGEGPFKSCVEILLSIWRTLS